MKWILPKFLFALYAILLVSEALIGTAIIFAAAAAAYVFEGNTTTTHPLRISKHPSTYFDVIKPIYNEYTHFGIYIKMPIGDVINHAKMALQFIGKMPYYGNDDLAIGVNSPTNKSNAIDSSSIDPKVVWGTSMNRLIRIKIKSLRKSIKEME